MTKIAFIGAGKMAESLIARLKGHSVYAADIDQKRLAYLKRRYKIKGTKSNRSAFDLADIVVLAVKPQDIRQVLGEVGHMSHVTSHKLIISIAAGVPLSYLERELSGLSVVRAMPNNPCLIGQGITALAKGKKVSAKLFKAAQDLFKAVGEVVKVPEKWLDGVTGLSGSGPAFVYQVVEGLTLGGVAAGLPQKIAKRLALQTIIGAAATVQASGHSPAHLTAMVASPGGTTIAGLQALKKRKFEQALEEAVLAAANTSKMLSSSFASNVERKAKR